MKNLGIRLITMSLMLSFFGSVFPMKRHREETPEQTMQMTLLSSDAKKPKIEQFKEINVKPRKSIQKETLFQKTGYALIHAILEGRITLEQVFEALPDEIFVPVVKLPLIHGQTLLYKATTGPEVKLLLDAKVPVVIYNEAEQDIPYVDHDGLTPLESLLSGNREEAAVVFLKFLDDNRPDLLNAYIGQRAQDIIRERGLNKVLECILNLNNLNDGYKVSKGQDILRDQLRKKGVCGCGSPNCDAEMFAELGNSMLDALASGVYSLVRYPAKRMHLENIFEHAMDRHSFDNTPYEESNVQKIKRYILPKAKHEEE